jgi:hypothetical protein
MSQAADLIAEAKQLLADATKELKAFEKDDEITQFSDLGHLRKVIVHTGALLENLRRHANPVPVVGDEPEAELEPADEDADETETGEESEEDTDQESSEDDGAED